MLNNITNQNDSSFKERCQNITQDQSNITSHNTTNDGYLGLMDLSDKRINESKIIQPTKSESPMIIGKSSPIKVFKGSGIKKEVVIASES